MKIVFTDSFAKNDGVKLLEIPEELESFFSNCTNDNNHDDKGISMIKGGENSKHTAFCTKDKTYQLRKVDNSNTLLLTTKRIVAENRDRIDCSYSLNQTFELSLVKPLFKSLHSKVIQNVVTNDELHLRDEEIKLFLSDKRVPCKRKLSGMIFELRDLLDTQVASFDEVLEVLRSFYCWHVIEVEPHAFLFLDRDELSNLARIFVKELKTINIDPMNISSIIMNTLQAALSGWHQYYIKLALRLLGYIQNVNGDFDLDHVKMAKQVSRFIFNEHDKVMEKSLFLRCLEDELPKVFPHINLDDLIGTCVDVDSGSKVQLLSLDDLILSDQEPKSVFKMLFNMKPEWRQSDLHAYVSHLSTPETTLAHLMKQYTIQCGEPAYAVSKASVGNPSRQTWVKQKR